MSRPVIGPVEFCQPPAQRSHGTCPVSESHEFHGTPRRSNISGECPGPWGPVPNPGAVDPVPCCRCSTGVPVPCVCAGPPVPRPHPRSAAPPNPHQP